MAVVKKTWNELMTENSSIEDIITSDVIDLASQLDDAFKTKYGVLTRVNDCIKLISQDYLTTVANDGNGLWEDLPIYMSSYRLRDRRICVQISDNLIRYLRFLVKMINDEGVTRKLYIQREFSNRNTSHNTDKNVYSETPELELQSFEDAIKYASNVSRSDNNGGSTQQGGSGETSTNVNWDEALKNLRFAFYNDIIDYIISIPSELYNYFSLDSRPITELVCARRKALHNLFNL